MDKQSLICLSIVVFIRFYAVRHRNLFVQITLHEIILRNIRLLYNRRVLRRKFQRMFEWSHRFDVLYLGCEFKERLAGNLEVFNESHRTVENHLTFCEMAVGNYSFSIVHKIIWISFIREFHVISHNAKVV